MPEPKTSWDLIRSAASGEPEARARFLELYGGIVQRTLEARWTGRALEQEVDDAVQDVWIQCFKPGGALERAMDRADRGFRAFLFGVTLNVARRREERRGAREVHLPSDPQVPSLATTLSSLFDRQWARALVVEARNRLLEQARRLGEDAVRRVELLRLRFFEDLPIREIAARWDEDPDRTHRQYAKAREEFRTSLRASIRRHDPRCEAEVERELERLLGDLAG